MNFKNYNFIINDNKYNMLFLIIYYGLTCNEFNIDKLTEDQKEKLIYFIYKTYLKDENHTDLFYICDKAIENIDKILNNDNYTSWDLLEVCY